VSVTSPPYVGAYNLSRFHAGCEMSWLKTFRWVLLAISLALPLAARAQLQVVPPETTPAVFPSQGRRIQVVFRNPSEQTVSANLRVKVLQASSATAMPVSEAPWKKLQVLPGQTVIETATFDFPAVKAPTRFLVQWIEGDRKLIGTTDVTVYPPDLLKDLKPLAGDLPLGVLDPLNRLKPALRRLKLEYDDVESGNLAPFTGRLAILGPFANRQQMPRGLARTIRERAKAGVAIVWIQPPADRQPRLEPTTYRLDIGHGVVVTDAHTMAALDEDPLAQLNLIRLARLALEPALLQLPELEP
jgi:hypothetical protein